MKINDFYHDSANITLNGALVALVPVVLIVMVNVFFVHMKEVMFFCIPFFAYSTLCFQNYLFKKNRSMKIFRTLDRGDQRKTKIRLLNSRHILLFFKPTFKPKLMLFFSDGTMAGEIVRVKKKMKKQDTMYPFKERQKMYILFDHEGIEIAKYIVSNNKRIIVDTYTAENEYLGSFLKDKPVGLIRGTKIILDSAGQFFGQVQGAPFYMKESIRNEENEEIARLSRGVLPVEWEGLFPDANTPLFTFNTPFSDNTKLLALSLLIDQYFIER